MQHLGKLAKKRGLPPGSLVHVGDAKSQPTSVIYTSYSKGHFLQKMTFQFDDLPDKPTEAQTVTWLDIMGLGDVGLIEALGKHIHIDPLIQEDIVNTTQLPKVQDIEGILFFVIKVLEMTESELHIEQLSILLKGNLVITFQEKEPDTLGAIKKRIEEKRGRIVEKKADYLVYCILDYVIDGYFLVLSKLDSRISFLEDEFDTISGADLLDELQLLYKRIASVRRYFWQTRDMIFNLRKMESAQVSRTLDKYFSDLSDHINLMMDISDAFREEVYQLRERLLSSINLKTNEVMKALTMVATVFLPLTFIAGIYGMNFRYFPELEYRYAYPVVLVIMLFIGIAIFIYYKRKRWL